MQAVAHSAAFANRVKIPQSVGRDYEAADRAAGKFQGKEHPMRRDTNAMAGGEGMSPRKAMASGKTDDGTFGVMQAAAMSNGPHPDHVAHTGMREAMEDHERATPPAIHHTKGHMPAQAAPHHGPHGHGGHPGSHDHFRRDKKA
jgi:hypothetical protein